MADVTLKRIAHNRKSFERTTDCLYPTIKFDNAKGAVWFLW